MTWNASRGFSFFREWFQGIALQSQDKPTERLLKEVQAKADEFLDKHIQGEEAPISTYLYWLLVADTMCQKLAHALFYSQGLE